MTWTEEQYERVARHLDGQTQALGPDEQRLAEEMLSGERMLTALDADVPATAMARARRRMIAAAAGAAGSLRRRVLKYVVGVEAAAVAGLVIVVGTLAMLAGPEIKKAFTAVPTSVLVESTQSSVNEDLRELGQELDALEAEIVASATPSDELHIESMEQDLKDLIESMPSGVDLFEDS